MAITKVVIAAAGEGTRMLHLSRNKPKHLIRVQDKPFLSYLLDNLLAAGFNEIFLVGGYKCELIDDFAKNYAAQTEKSTGKKFTIRVINQYEILGPKDKIYGTACPLMCVKDIIGKDDFLFICGDNLYSVKDLKTMAEVGEGSYIAGLEHKNPQKYGVLVEKDGFLEKIVEKPKEYVGNVINPSLYKFNSEVFGKLSEIKKSPRGEYEITDVINLLAKGKKVRVVKIQDYWHDFGGPADIIKISRFIKNGNNKNK